MQKLPESWAIRPRRIIHIKLYRWKIAFIVLCEPVFKNIVQTILHVYNIRIWVKLSDITLYLHLPLPLCIGNLRQLCISGEHFFTNHILSVKLRNYVVHTVFVSIVLFRCIENRCFLRHIRCQNIRKKSQPTLRHLIPIGNILRIFTSVLSFAVRFKLLVNLFVEWEQRFNIGVFEIKFLFQKMSDYCICGNCVNIKQKVLCKLSHSLQILNSRRTDLHIVNQSL